MTQLSDDSEKTHERFSSIVNYAIFFGFYAPFVPWAWYKTTELIKLTPIAFKQVIHEDRSISSLLLPFMLIIELVLVNIFYMWRLNKWRKGFLSLYKEELINFKNAPIKTLVALIKVTSAVALFGGSAFLVSKFVMFPQLSIYF